MRRRMLGAAVLAALSYAVLWIAYLQQAAWLATFDDWFLRPLAQFGLTHPAWVAGWDWFCTLLGPGMFRIVALPAIVWLMIRQKLRIAVFLVLTVEVSGVLTEVAKALADRPRPATALVYAYGSSFPSGHALGVLVSVLAILTVTLPVLARRWQTMLMVLGAVVVIGIGLGRVVLNVHHPSDVLAGWALGFCYYAACLPMLNVREGTPVAPDTAR